VGLLRLERITWGGSSAALLEKAPPHRHPGSAPRPRSQLSSASLEPSPARYSAFPCRQGVPQHRGMPCPHLYPAGPDTSISAAQVMRYEAVHPFDGWEDLRARLAPDRRVFAFFHARRAPRQPARAAPAAAPCALWSRHESWS